MGFSSDLREKAAPIWAAEKRHPFVTGIGDGSLALEKFRFYMRQDYIFLVEFSRAVSLAAAKAQSSPTAAGSARGARR